ncbi:MAG: 1-acyl-sn-glycerol-3-phosphate acyltransferase [Oscillospiraceae bacterium]|nr:1-acyl-sn-glycerol-3-phosphate acyltransferase [Oscillospiraceae bacterium]
MSGFYKFAIGVMRLVMPIWYKIDADGLEYLPEEGGYLFVSNHRSMADPILIGIQNPAAQFCFLAKQELFEDGFIGWLLKKLGAIAIDRGTGDTDPLEEIIFRLQNGDNALIFPEGTRSKDGTLGKFKTGAALIAAQTNVPVVPVGIYFDDDELHFRSTIHIRYGEPFRIPQTDPKNPSPAVLKQIRREMTENVSALLTADNGWGPKAIEVKEKSSSDTEESAEPVKRKSAAENQESEGTEKKMSKHNQNEKNHKEKPEEEKDIFKEIEDDIDEEFSDEIDEAAEKIEDAAETVKETGKKAVKDTADAIDELDEKEEKAAKKAASAMKASAPFKKRLKEEDTELDEKIAEDEEDIFDEPKKSEKDDAPETADEPEEKFFEEEDFDEDFDFDEKPGLFGGFSLKNPFKKKKSVADFDDEFDEDIDEDNIDNSYEEDDLDDDEYDDEVVGRRIDYGKIALILTFVILGIFAIDFLVRLWKDYQNAKGLLDLQNQAQAVESMVDSSLAETDVAPAVTEAIETLATEVTTTVSAETAVTTTTTEAFVDNRDTQTIEVGNDTVHSGSMILIDGTHAQLNTPALVPFSSFPYQHLRLVSTEMTVDASLATPITNWFNDFFAATGLGNVMVYSTTGTPGYPPYSVAIPERTAGLSLDLSILNEAAASHAPYTPDGNYAWLTEHAADYGFIVRYPAGKADKTGQEGMSWHFRYVGAPHAKYMYDNDLCLEEYLEEIKKHTVSTDHLETTVNGINYEMYYVAADTTGTTTQVKYPVAADGSTPMISGDNDGGFIVAVVKQ